MGKSKDLATRTFNDDLAFDTSTLYVDSSNDRVGIGTTSPSAPLDVAGNNASGPVAEFRAVNASNEGSILIDSPTDSDLRPSYLRLARGGTNEWTIGGLYGDTSRGVHFYDHGSSSTRMIIQSDGKVGIGSTSPSRKLTVANGDTSTEGNVVAVRNANSTGGAFINFLGGGNNAPSVGAKGNDIVLTHDGYSGNELMRVDSAGRVTKPYQPAFSAHLTSNQANVTGATVYYDLICNSTQQNRGNHFSTSTGRFTAPIAGLYLFTAHILFSTQASGRATEFWFDVNGQAQRWFVDRKILSSTSSSMQTVNGSAVISLSANDYVIPRGFVLGGSQDVSIVGSGGLASVVTNFTGYLIG